MPELPEVEIATRILRAHAEGRTIARLELRHASLRRRLAPSALRTLAGARIVHVARRGKQMYAHLADGRTLAIHFRMTGDWRALTAGESPAATVRAIFHFADAPPLALDDSRALATITLHAADTPPLPALGPEADDPALDAPTLLAALATKRMALKPALLDQRVIAGIGNIYASESLWRAKLDPFRPARSLARAEANALLRAMRFVLARALGDPGRYATGDSTPLDVYDREGAPCRRCRTPIARDVQSGRSTYWCPRCQAS